jgi:hypothetical protein
MSAGLYLGHLMGDGHHKIRVVMMITLQYYLNTLSNCEVDGSGSDRARCYTMKHWVVLPGW